jgi:hypothetical protein
MVGSSRAIVPVCANDSPRGLRVMEEANRDTRGARPCSRITARIVQGAEPRVVPLWQAMPQAPIVHLPLPVPFCSPCCSGNPRVALHCMVIYSMHDDDDRHMGSEDSDEDFEPNVEGELIRLARSMRMASHALRDQSSTPTASGRRHRTICRRHMAMPTATVGIMLSE